MHCPTCSEEVEAYERDSSNEQCIVRLQAYATYCKTLDKSEWVNTEKLPICWECGKKLVPVEADE